MRGMVNFGESVDGVGFGRRVWTYNLFLVVRFEAVYVYQVDSGGIELR